MNQPWVLAFLVALALTVLTTPWMRHLARRADFVDQPSLRKSHRDPVPYLGGIAIIVSVLMALLVAGPRSNAVSFMALGAAVLGAIGLVDDDRTLGARARLTAQLLAAIGAVALGLRIHATGLAAFDVPLTVLWVVGITNAVNFLDNMDGLATGVAAAAGLAILTLALVGHQEVNAVAAAALTGACLGFLAYNRRPASIFMGDAGSLFLGFMLAVLSVDVNPLLRPQASFVVPIILLSLPVLDTATVSFSRLRRGRSVLVGGSDHLSHRLVARGLSPSASVAVLVAAQLTLGALAVMAGYQALPWVWATVAATLVLAVLTAATLTVPVYTETVVGLPRWLARAPFLILGVASVVAAPAIASLVRAYGSAHAGAESVTVALRRAPGMSRDQSSTALARATSSLRRAERQLDGPILDLGQAVPGLSSNLRATRALVGAATQLAASGAELAALFESAQASVEGGLDLDDVERFSPALEKLTAVLDRAELSLKGADRPFLLKPVSQALTRLQAELDRAQEMAGVTREALRLLPEMLGGRGRRRYLVVAAKPGADGTSTVVPAWGELVADDGRLRMERAGPPPDPGLLGGNGIFLSPDFPTAARALQQRYVAAGGSPVDGIMAFDPEALSALSAAVGGSGGSGSAGATPDLASEIWASALSTGLGPIGNVVGALAPVVRGGHLVMSMRDPSEQALISRVGMDGAVPAVRGDSLLVIASAEARSARTADPTGTQVRYDVRIDPGGRDLSAFLELQLDAAGVGPQRPGTTPVSVFSPLSARRASVDGHSVEIRSDLELGRQMHRIALGDGTARPLLRLELSGAAQLSPGGWYRLDLLRQPLADPPDLQVSVRVPSGWKIVEAPGMATHGDRWASASLRPTRPRQIWVQIQPAGLVGIWYSLLGRP